MAREKLEDDRTVERSDMRTFSKYCLVQVPGWLVAGLAGVGLTIWVGLPLWVAPALLLLWVVKDLALFPVVRRAYETNVPTGAEQLVGARGRTRDTLDPEGYVEVRGELWRARSDPTGPAIPQGTAVRVARARGLTLVVTREDANPGPPGA